jgi:uncharacterized protein YndB with AHSA1/START domain
MPDYTATTFIAANPDDVFRLITTPQRLSEWNPAIIGVVEAPENLAVDAQWVVTVRALGQSWPSRSTVIDLDPSSRRFVYRSQTDDGNPSYAEWSWHVTDAPGGCEVNVSYALHPATFWRRVLLVRIRTRQLRNRELPASLAALASHAAMINNP